MKKNLISVIILALLIVNVVLTAIMMFSVTSASRKTAALVDNIAWFLLAFPLIQSRMDSKNILLICHLSSR